MVNEKSHERSERAKSKLSYKVILIEGFSLYCDWENTQDRKYGGIDIDTLRRELAETKKASKEKSHDEFQKIAKK